VDLEERSARSRRTADDRARSARLGRSGEAYVARLYERAGYSILDRNWRHGRLEIDLVAARHGEVVFIEVKTRRPTPQHAGELVHPAQRRRIARAAGAWLRQHPRVGRTSRFDVVCLTVRPGRPPDVLHVPAAFEADGW
jgi:putative endonuclease